MAPGYIYFYLFIKTIDEDWNENDRFVRRCCILTCPVASTETTPRRSPIVILTLHPSPIMFVLFVLVLARK